MDESIFARMHKDCASCHEIRCGVTSSWPQMKVDRGTMLDSAISKNGEEMHLRADVKAIPPCCSALHHRPLRILMEDNIRMRQAMNSTVLTLMQWVRQNKEHTEQVRKLVKTMKERDQQREKEWNSLQLNLATVAVQITAIEGDLATERKNRLLANRENAVAKQLILKLQEENWGLRKARSKALISRNADFRSANGFPNQLPISRLDFPR